MVSYKNNEFYYVKSPPKLIQEKRFIKSEINIKKIWKNPKKRFKKLDFSSFDLVFESSKTDKRNSKKGQYDSSHTFVQTAGNGVKAQMSYIGRGCSPLPGWAVGARARWQQESARELGSLADPGEPWAPLERLISPCSGLIWFSWGAQKKKKKLPSPHSGQPTPVSTGDTSAWRCLGRQPVLGLLACGKTTLVWNGPDHQRGLVGAA